MIGWLTSLSTKALIAVAVFVLITLGGGATGLYWKGRIDGKAGCETVQLRDTLKSERKVTKAREKARAAVPQTDDIPQLLDFLDDHAVPRAY